MENITRTIDLIKETILKHVPAKCIYLFGSHAYGEPTENSDIDIFLVVPDDVTSHLELYGKIMYDLSLKKIYYVDLLISRECVFNKRKTFFLEEKVIQKGRVLYAS